MTPIPPSRWQIVERGRRLEVIDRQARSRPDGPDRAAGRSSSTWRPRRTRFDGQVEWTTHRIYDLNAPRTVRLDGDHWAWIVRAVTVLASLIAVAAIMMPLAIPVAAAIAVAGRRQAKATATAWIDRATDQAGTDSNAG